jgi:hypothetical protein
MKIPKRSERLANMVLRKHPLKMQPTDEAMRHNLGLTQRKRIGWLVGISNGYLRVRVGSKKQPGAWASSYWRPAK